jgi:hypothetical protein
MSIPFDKRVTIPEDVLVSEVDGEAVILNLKTETYFGLSSVGARMWAAVTTADSIQAGYEILRGEFEVDPEELRQDLGGVLEKLVEHGLIELQ